MPANEPRAIENIIQAIHTYSRFMEYLGGEEDRWAAEIADMLGIAGRAMGVDMDHLPEPCPTMVKQDIDSLLVGLLVHVRGQDIDSFADAMAAVLPKLPRFL